MNNVNLIGRLTRDVELRFLPSGTAVATLSVAVSGGSKDNPKTHFFNVIAFDKQAESCNSYLDKGKKVGISGSLQQKSWEKDGVKRSTVEIKAHHVEFLTPKPKVQEDKNLGQAPEDEGLLNEDEL